MIKKNAIKKNGILVEMFLYKAEDVVFLPSSVPPYSASIIMLVSQGECWLVSSLCLQHHSCGRGLLQGKVHAKGHCGAVPHQVDPA